LRRHPGRSNVAGTGMLRGAGTDIFGRFGAVLVGLCLGGMAVACSPALAAAPPNDNFANPQTISAGSVSPGTLVNATAELNEPAHAGTAAGHSVWYQWTAAETSRVGLETCTGGAGAINPRKAIYVGNAVDSLELVADDSYTPYCSMTFVADAGETYEIALDSNNPGTFNLGLTTYLPRPPNDDFGSAEVVPSSLNPVAVQGTSYGATWEEGEPDFFLDLPAEATVWYRWTAPATGTVQIDNCQPSGDPVMAAYAGNNFGALTQLDANDDGCDYGTTINDTYVGSILVFNVVKDHEYRIAVDDLFDESTNPSSHFTLYLDMDVEAPSSGTSLGSPAPPGWSIPARTKKRCKQRHRASSAKKQCKKHKKH
jgi:hypothetical protein